MQLLLTVFLVDSTEKHAAGFKPHHGSGREVRDRNERLADELFGLIISVNA